MIFDEDLEDGEIEEEVIVEEEEKNTSDSKIEPNPSTNPKKRVNPTPHFPPLPPPPKKAKHQQHSTTNGNNSGAHSPPRENGVDQINILMDPVDSFPESANEVRLNFNKWYHLKNTMNNKFRLLSSELQKIILHAVSPTSFGASEYVSLSQTNAQKRRVFVVVLNAHPSFLRQQRDSGRLAFLRACSSLPCILAKTMRQRNIHNILPASQLLFRMDKPPVQNLNALSVSALYHQHEIFFLAKHSRGWCDEIILQPGGTFFRKSVNDSGGEWKLDGDLLHLIWKRHNPMSNTYDTICTDVLTGGLTMHKLVTSDLLDQTYMTEIKAAVVSEKPEKSDNNIPRLSLSILRAVEVSKENEQCTPSNVEDTNFLGQKNLLYYVLSNEDLEYHNFPMNISKEQTRLMKCTKQLSKDHYRQSPASSTDKIENSSFTIYGLDCEMCETQLGMEVTRITLVKVDMNNYASTERNVVYDQFVLPENKILNYHTEFSGITAEILETRETCTLSAAQDVLLENFLTSTAILVGHSLSNDLRALRLIHKLIIDTSVLYPHPRGFPFKQSLKFLSQIYLNKTIQEDAVLGHDSAEDAQVSVDLFRLKLIKGPSFGLPQIKRHARSFETLDQIVHKDCPDVSFRFYEMQSSNSNQKPWNRYASGAMEDMYHSPSKRHSASVSDLPSLFDLLQANDKENENIRVNWLELRNSQSNTKQFIENLEQWEKEQQVLLSSVDAFLSNVYDNILSRGDIILSIPQLDLTLLRELKAKRTQAKWNQKDEVNSPSSWLDEHQEAMDDALSGVLDSCMFLKQK